MRKLLRQVTCNGRSLSSDLYTAYQHIIYRISKSDVA